MAQQAKWPPVMQVSLVGIPAALLLIQLPASVPGKAMEKSLSPWAFAHTWDMHKKLLAPGFRQA